MPTPTNSKFQAPFFAGVDVGGTNIKIGIVDDRGQIIAQDKFPTVPDQPAALGFETAKQGLSLLLQQCGIEWNQIAAVGLGTPGPMDIKSGSILTPTNLPGWHHTPIRDQLTEILNKPVTLANDAAAAAFGEFWVGSGQDYASLVLLTLGTGVGGGIIVDNVSIDGHHSHGAEVGHIRIDNSSTARMCGCGQPGHLEAYASATAIVDRTQEALSNDGGGKSSILNLQISDKNPLTALMIGQAAATGDTFAVRMVEETARYLADGIATLAHVIDPEAFILGGAMNFGGSSTALGQKFLDDIATATRQQIFPVLAERLVIKFAALGGDAGFIGAAGLAREQYRKK